VFEPDTTTPDWDDDPFVLDSERSSGRDEVLIENREDEAEEEEEAEDDDEEIEDEIAGEEEEDESEYERPRPATRPRSAKRRASRKASHRGQTSPARFAIRCLLGVVLGYAVLGIYITSFPANARELMRKIPVVGVHLARTRLGASQISVDDVRGRFERLADRRNARTAFVVTGTAMNHARVAAEGIELVVQLIGDTTATARIPCTGAVVDVSQLTERELGLMTKLHRTRTARVEPGTGVICQAVFLEYPAGLQRATLEVATARGR
jgi:hypothetical protein